MHEFMRKQLWQIVFPNMLMFRIKYDLTLQEIIASHSITPHINLHILIIEVSPKQLLHFRCSATDGILPNTSIYFLRYL